MICVPDSTSMSLTCVSDAPPCAAGQMLVLEKAEALQEEAEVMLDGLKWSQFHASRGAAQLLPGRAGAGRPSCPSTATAAVGDPGRDSVWAEGGR